MLLNFTAGPVDESDKELEVYELNLSPEEELEFMELVMKFSDKKGGTCRQIVNQAMIISLQMIYAMPNLLPALVKKRNAKFTPNKTSPSNYSSPQVTIGEDDDEYVDD